MNRELFAKLAAQSQAGTPEAMEALLLQAYTPISYLCGELLPDSNAAQGLTREILALVCAQLDSLGDPEEFEAWICRITAARCLSTLDRLRRQGIETQDPPKNVQIPRQALDEVQTALAVQQMANQLPEQSRLCLLLYCCGQLEIKGIARLTGTSEAAVLDNLTRAQDNINKQLRKFHKMGIRFAKITSLPELMQTAMYQSENQEAAAAMVDSILEKNTPVSVPVIPAKQRKDPVRVLLAGTVAAALPLLFMLVLLFFQST